MNEQIMPSPAQPSKAQRRGRCVGTVSATVRAPVLASSDHFQESVTVRIEDRRHSRGVIVATFGQTKIEAHTITPTANGVRLEHKDTHRERVIRHFWIEIGAAKWEQLLTKAGVQQAVILGVGPEPTPMPPAPPLPDLRDYYPTGKVAGNGYDVMAVRP